MSLVGFSLIFCGLINLFLAIYVFWRRHNRPQHYALTATIFGVALYNFVLFGISSSVDIATVTLMGRLAFALGAASSTGFLVFTRLFPETAHPRPSRLVILAVALAGSAVVGLSLTPLVQASVEMGVLGKRPVFGPLHPVFGLYLVTVFTWSTWNLFRSRLRTPSGRERLQLEYVLTGWAMAFVIVILAHFVMPLLSTRSDVWLVGGAISTVCCLSMTSYAILRHRLMDIGIALRNVLIRAILAVILTTMVLLPFLVDKFSDARVTFVSELLIILILTVSLTIYLPDIQHGISRFVDQHIFRGRYGHETALVRFGDRLLRTYGREDIAALIATEIPIILQAQGAAVYLSVEEEGADFALASPDAIDGAHAPELLAASDPLLLAVLARRRPLVKDDIAYRQSRPERADDVLRTFERLKATVACPLICQNRLLGLLLLGEKRQDNVFTSDDLELLGALVSQAAIALDNTRLYEQAIAAKKHYETMLRHMQRGVLTVDTSLRIITLNDMGAAILGVSGAGCLGRPVAEMVPEFSNLVSATFEKRADQPAMEIELALANGSIPCECETSLMLDARNRLIGAMLVFQDLTGRKRFQEEVRRMERLASVGTLAAGIAHEIKNPLVSIQTFTQLLPERYHDPSFRDGFGAIVRDEVSRINKLVQSLLEFARPRPQQTAPVSVHELLDRALLLLESELRKQNIEVTRAYGGDVPIIAGDGEKLFQVFFNLLQNAIQAMEGQERQIFLTTARHAMNHGSRHHDAVLLTIRDTGKGIDAADIPRIFDPFFSTKTNGSGLGLSICHTILEEHGARIDVDSTPGKGTTFSLALPLKSKAAGVEMSTSKEPSCRA